jgi:ABC-type lipoprotein export system ATPase subunit
VALTIWRAAPIEASWRDRVILKDAPILPLDEPTGELDGDNAKKVQQALREAM